MYSIIVEDNFCAAHVLPGVAKCERMHGHNYRVEVEVSAEGLNCRGFVADFRFVKEVLRGVLEVLDHKFLAPAHAVERYAGSSVLLWLGNKAYGLPEEDVFLLAVPAVTAEHLAQYLWEELRGVFTEVAVTVWETPKSRATYSGGPVVGEEGE